MNPEVCEALEKTVLESLDQIDTSVEIGSDEYKRIMDAVNDTMKILVEDKKSCSEVHLKEKEQRAQIRNDRTKIFVNAMTEVTKIGVVMILTAGILKFEEEGTLRSKAWQWGTKLLKL